MKFEAWIRAAAVGAVASFLAAVPVRADEQLALGTRAGLEWLNSMRNAMGTLNYRGVVAYLKGNKVDSMEFVHARLDGVEHERLLSLNSPMREIVRSGDQVHFFFPETQSLLSERIPLTRSFLVDLPDTFAGLCDYYAFVLGGQEYIAQRLAQKIDIVPVDDYRYARKIWVDRESRLPLKFELIDENDQPIEQMVFTSLHIASEIPAEALAPVSSAEGFSKRPSESQSLAIESLNWTLENVPIGFQIRAYSRIRRFPLNRPIEHILLSDGLSSVSIYIDEIGDEPSLGKARKIGAVNAYTRKIGPYLVTVMGEVPGKTVQTIANGIRPPKSSHK
jgi:sigma-E factor negative regulatory protein RseB